jgi:hypothetical protein
MRRQRIDTPLDPGQCYRVADDLPRRLVVRMSKPPAPRITPGEHRVGLDLGNYARYPGRGLGGGVNARVRKVQESGFDAQDLARDSPMVRAPPDDLFDGDRPQGFSHLTAGEPHEDNPVAAFHLGSHGCDHAHLVIGVGQGH